MIRIKQFFSFSEHYREETKQYHKIDLFIVSVFYCVLLIFYYGLGKLFASLNHLTEPFILTSSAIFCIAIIGFMVLLLVFRKQKIASIGFDKTNKMKSLKLGLLLTMVIIGSFLLINRLLGNQIHATLFSSMIYLVYYLFEIALFEEVVFRGYIGTRLYGVIPNKYLAISLTGMMFVLMHVPFHMVMENLSIGEYILNNWTNLVFIFFLHFVFQFLYAKFNHLFAPTLFHFAWDYAQWFM